MPIQFINIKILEITGALIISMYFIRSYFYYLQLKKQKKLPIDRIGTSLLLLLIIMDFTWFFPFLKSLSLLNLFI